MRPSPALTYLADDQRVYRSAEAIRNRVELWLNPHIGIMGSTGRLSIAEAVEFVDHNFGEPLSVADLAGRCHLSAVQQAREAARRTQCKNNLKQIGLRLTNIIRPQRSLAKKRSPSIWSSSRMARRAAASVLGHARRAVIGLE